MNKKYIFDFLQKLKRNNSKEWMDVNRAMYHKSKAIWLTEIEDILQRLRQHDSRFENIPPKSTLSSINNNRRFHPDKPIYKDFFTCTPDGSKGVANFHILISPGNKSFIGGGFHRPDKQIVAKVRAGIDYNGGELLDILQEEKLMAFYGGLANDPQKLKTSPQGYSIEHPYIELLRRKNFTAIRYLTDEEVLSNSFINTVEEGYLAIQTFLDYLNQAASFEDEML